MMKPVEESLPVILLVDDEPRILSALQRLLRREPYRIITAGSGADALRLLDQETVSVVVSDLRMPEMDGFETCRRLKQIFRVLRSVERGSRQIFFSHVAWLTTSNQIRRHVGFIAGQPVLPQRPVRRPSFGTLRE